MNRHRKTNRDRIGRILNFVGEYHRDDVVGGIDTGWSEGAIFDFAAVLPYLTEQEAQELLQWSRRDKLKEGDKRFEGFDLAAPDIRALLIIVRGEVDRRTVQGIYASDGMRSIVAKPAIRGLLRGWDFWKLRELAPQYHPDLTVLHLFAMDPYPEKICYLAGIFKTLRESGITLNIAIFTHMVQLPQELLHDLYVKIKEAENHKLWEGADERKKRFISDFQTGETSYLGHFLPKIKEDELSRVERELPAKIHALVRFASSFYHYEELAFIRRQFFSRAREKLDAAEIEELLVRLHREFGYSESYKHAWCLMYDDDYPARIRRFLEDYFSGRDQKARKSA